MTIRFGILVSILSFSAHTALAGKVAATDTAEITGTVIIAKELKDKLGSNGVLFVFAKPFAQQAGGPPLAVKRIPSPKFPVKFSLSQADAMMPGTVFAGNLKITARFSPSGDVMDRSGYEGSFSGKNGVSVNEKTPIEVIIDKKL